MSCSITFHDNLPPITSRGFSCGIKGFRFNEVSRIPPDELKAMFEQKRGQAKKDRKGYRLSKSDIQAQLQLYGIPCSGVEGVRVAVMRNILAEAVKDGKCDSPTDEITKLETFLKAEYLARNTSHIASLTKTRQAEFDAITDPTSAADYSMPLFLHRYFLNDDGSPNPTKTTHPIALPGYESLGMMEKATSKIKGLHMCIDGRLWTEVLALGWDREATLGAAKKAAVEYLDQLESKYLDGGGSIGQGA